MLLYEPLPRKYTFGHVFPVKIHHQPVHPHTVIRFGGYTTYSSSTQQSMNFFLLMDINRPTNIMGLMNSVIGKLVCICSADEKKNVCEDLIMVPLCVLPKLKKCAQLRKLCWILSTYSSAFFFILSSLIALQLYSKRTSLWRYMTNSDLGQPADQHIVTRIFSDTCSYVEVWYPKQHLGNWGSHYTAQMCRLVLFLLTINDAP